MVAPPPGFTLDKKPSSGAALPPGFTLDKPEDPAALGEMSALTQDPGLAARDKMKAAYEASPWYKKAAIDAFDVPNLVAEGGSAHLLDKGVALARAPFTDLTYDEELAKQREHVKQAQARQGPAVSALSEGIGAMALGSKVGLGGNILTRTGIGALEGAGYGGARAYAGDEDVAKGLGHGALWGAGGNVIGEGVHNAAKVAQGALGVAKDPTFRQQVWDYGKDAAISSGAGYLANQLGIGDTSTNAALTFLGLRGGRARAPDINVPAPSQPLPGAPGLRETLYKLISRGGQQ